MPCLLRLLRWPALRSCSESGSGLGAWFGFRFGLGFGFELGFGFGFGFGFGLGFGFDPHLHPVPAGSARRLHRRERPARGALQQVPAVLRERRHERSALRPHGRQVLGQANQARLGLLAAVNFEQF